MLEHQNSILYMLYIHYIIMTVCLPLQVKYITACFIYGL